MNKETRLILENQKIMMNVLRCVAENYDKDAWANKLYHQVIKTGRALQ